MTPSSNSNAAIGGGKLPRLIGRYLRAGVVLSGNSIVQAALNNQWLKEQGVPELRTIWIKLHYGDGITPAAKV